MAFNHHDGTDGTTEEGSCSYHLPLSRCDHHALADRSCVTVSRLQPFHLILLSWLLSSRSVWTVSVQLPCMSTSIGLAAMKEQPSNSACPNGSLPVRLHRRWTPRVIIIPTLSALVAHRRLSIDNLRCHQWRQSWHQDYSFSMIAHENSVSHKNCTRLRGALFCCGYTWSFIVFNVNDLSTIFSVVAQATMS